MKRTLTFGIAIIAMPFILNSVYAIQGTFSATGNVTVQPNGPRTGTNGTNFFNIEGASNGNNASYGVVDIPLTDASTLFGGTVSSINSVTLNLTRQDSAFTRSWAIQHLLHGKFNREYRQYRATGKRFAVAFCRRHRQHECRHCDRRPRAARYQLAASAQSTRLIHVSRYREHRNGNSRFHSAHIQRQRIDGFSQPFE